MADAFAADDGIKRRRPSHDVVGFNREHLTKRIRRAVPEKRPHFHFSEPLSADLRLAAERLLGDERVRTDRAHVDFIFHHVVELYDVHVADGEFLLKGLAGATISEQELAVLRKPG